MRKDVSLIKLVPKRRHEHCLPGRDEAAHLSVWWFGGSELSDSVLVQGGVLVGSDGARREALGLSQCSG